jgi:hypothetical protein
MNLNQLREMMASGQFHHATYRDFGTLWEGLWIYRKYDGLRGFEPAGMFSKDSPDQDAAFELVRGTGVSVGAYGQG